MSCDYTILTSFGLAYIRLAGIVRPGDSLRSLTRFARDPEATPDLNQLLDMRDVTGMKLDVLDLLRMHARKAEIFAPSEHDRLFVHLADTPMARKVAGYVVKSWDKVPGITHRIVPDEEQALDILGLRQRTIEALIQQQRA
ncbi:hypothetical protein PSM7751_01033 [Pseudooceanicola marinus]|uniref:Uncharacterized protein n=1 Tax=Pseudooceanicola marinus TaxID=396013 RepID=A0A1X6YP13_9RHOB|nr:hypothetical protein [Pseudooceanicola marinus]PJE29510.1 hypothetical protein CVM50_13485 [Pseudooceanicola marinus]SLN27191.1 hypothetical protein PSM7751_01033 [Pseudooceanicola marinus]